MATRKDASGTWDLADKPGGADKLIMPSAAFDLSRSTLPAHTPKTLVELIEETILKMKSEGKI